MNEHLKNTLPLLLLALLLLISLAAYELSDLVTLEKIKAHKTEIRAFLDEHYLLCLVAFFVACTLFINSPVPLAAALKFLGGFFFGFYQGALYNILATIIACLVGFSLSRYALKEHFEKLYYRRLQAIEDEIERNGFYYFLSLRLVLVVPYFLINILAGISRLSFRQFFFSTALGVIPGSLVYANGGAKLEQIDSLQDLFRSDILFAFAGILLLVWLPKLLHRAKA